MFTMNWKYIRKTLGFNTISPQINLNPMKINKISRSSILILPTLCDSKSPPKEDSQCISLMCVLKRRKNILFFPLTLQFFPEFFFFSFFPFLRACFFPFFFPFSLVLSLYKKALLPHNLLFLINKSRAPKTLFKFSHPYPAIFCVCGRPKRSHCNSM